MEALVLLLLSILGGLFYYKQKATKAEVAKKLAKTTAIDIALREQQGEIEAAIAALDAGIEKAKVEREIQKRKEEFDSLTLKQRADLIKKRLK